MLRSSYIERLSIMYLPLFSERQNRSDLIITYRALNGLFNADLGTVFSLNYDEQLHGQLGGNTFSVEQSVLFMESMTTCHCWRYPLLTVLRTNTTTGCTVSCCQSRKNVYFILFFFIFTLLLHSIFQMLFILAERFSFLFSHSLKI